LIDVEATTAVRSYDITLGFHGRMDALSITYRSDPPLSSNDIIQLLAFGRTQTEMEQQTTVQQNAFPESASDQILSQALNLALSSRVQRLFGITRVKIDPTIGGTENNPSGAKITVEQQVANNFTVTYITDVTRSTQQVIQVEYNINHNLSVSAIRDQNGVLSVDIRLRQRKR
jgi:translocation and assembly module TamB